MTVAPQSPKHHGQIIENFEVFSCFFSHKIVQLLQKTTLMTINSGENLSWLLVAYASRLWRELWLSTYSFFRSYNGCPNHGSAELWNVCLQNGSQVRCLIAPVHMNTRRTERC